MAGEKVDQLELMNSQKLWKSWVLEKYYWTALIVMVRVKILPACTILVIIHEVDFIWWSWSKICYYRFTGQGKGFDIDLVKLISEAVSIPVIASSGAGCVDHFSEVFTKTNASAALAAGIFHRKEVSNSSPFSWLSVEFPVINLPISVRLLERRGLM